MSISPRTLARVATAVALVGLLAGSADAKPKKDDDNVVIVSGNNTDGWAIVESEPYTTEFAFEDGPSVLGQGSLSVPAIDGDDLDKFIAYFDFGGATPVADFEQFTIDFQVIDESADTRFQQFYVNVGTIDGGDPNETFYDCRYDVVASAGSEAGFTTLVVDGSAPLAMDDSTPGGCAATLGDASGVINYFSVNIGDTSANDAGVGGYLDNATFTVDGATTVYDFESSSRPESADDCKNGGFADFGFRNQGQCVSSVQSNRG